MRFYKRNLNLTYLTFNFRLKIRDVIRLQVLEKKVLFFTRLMIFNKQGVSLVKIHAERIFLKLKMQYIG